MTPFDEALTHRFDEWRNQNRDGRGDECIEIKGGCTHSHKRCQQMNQKAVCVSISCVQPVCLYVIECMLFSLLLAIMKACQWKLCFSVLTATGAVELDVLLWVAFKATVETMLPELCKPGVPVVVFRTKFKVVFVKPLHISRLQFYGDTSGGLLDVTVGHVISVCPSIAATRHKGRQARKLRKPLNSYVRVKIRAPLFHNHNTICIIPLRLCGGVHWLFQYTFADYVAQAVLRNLLYIFFFLNVNKLGEDWDLAFTVWISVTESWWSFFSGSKVVLQYIKRVGLMNMRLTADTSKKKWRGGGGGKYKSWSVMKNERYPLPYKDLGVGSMFPIFVLI